jgi:hypothetical protein
VAINEYTFLHILVFEAHPMQPAPGCSSSYCTRNS